MKTFKFYLLLMLGLMISFAVVSCDKDEPKMTDSDEITDFLNGRAFSYRDVTANDDGGNDYTHSIMFNATSSTGGTYEYECRWKDISSSGINSGTNYGDGRFDVRDGKIFITVYRGNEWGVEYFVVIGDNLMSNNGELYQSINKPTDSGNPPVSSHKHPLDYYQTQYNSVISQIIAEFMTFDTAKAVGDKEGARRSSNEIKSLQKSAKAIREDAKQDGWTIKADPYETKSANV